MRQLREEIRAAYGEADIVGSSEALRDVVHQAELVAAGDTTVLLFGETGTGKEVFARFIHDRSGRSAGPFVPVNCGALPEALVETELFGHERGAFTGAVASKPGKFELANHGTLFLDEIGDLPADAQAKLLRVLQDRQVQRIGATQLTRVDVRLIAATNQDLQTAVAEKRLSRGRRVTDARHAAFSRWPTPNARPFAPPWTRPSGASAARVARPSTSGSNRPHSTPR